MRKTGKQYIKKLSKQLAITFLALAFVATVVWFETKKASGFEGKSTFPAIEMGITDDSNNIFNGDSPFVIAINSPVIKVNDSFKNYKPSNNAVVLPIDWGIGNGQCVKFVRYVTGVDIFGNASAWVKYINSDTPQVGDIVVIRYSKWQWHVGIVSKVDNDSITVRSRNVRGKYIVSDDKFRLDDSRVVGYISY